MRPEEQQERAPATRCRLDTDENRTRETPEPSVTLTTPSSANSVETEYATAHRLRQI